MAGVRSYLARLGNSDAINWLSVVSVMVFQTCASLITSGISFYDSFALFLSVRLGSLLAFVAILAAGKWLLLRLATRRPQPLITVAAFLLGITASTALFDWLLVVTSLAEQSFLVRRVLLSLVGATVILIMVALVVTTAREYEENNRGLKRAIEHTQLLRQDTTQRIEARRDDLLATIQGRINTELDEMALSGAKADEVMRNLIDDVIRPLSYTLGAPPALRPHAALSASVSLPWRQVLRGALSGNPYAPVAFPGAIAAIVATFLVMSFGFVGGAVTGAVFVGAMLLNAVWRVVWPVLPERTPLTIRFALFTLTVVPFTAVAVWFIELTTGFNLASSQVRLMAWTIIVVSTWWVAALTSSVFRQLKTTSIALDKALTEQKTELASLNGTDLRLRKNISRLLHGPIQETVASSLRKLQSDPSLADDPEFFDTLRHRIDSTLRSFDRESAAPVNVVDELDDLREVWEGSVTINSAIPEHALSVLARHSETAATLLELIREACHNATKHGDAKTIDIRIDVDAAQHLATLSVANDGAPPPLNSQPGMGSALFDDLTVSWEKKATEKGLLVTATVPLTGH